MCFKQFITIVQIDSGTVNVPGVLHYTYAPTTEHMQCTSLKTMDPAWTVITF